MSERHRGKKLHGCGSSLNQGKRYVDLAIVPTGYKQVIYNLSLRGIYVRSEERNDSSL